MILFKLLFYFGLIFIAMFILLGILSQKGKAKGLEGGRLTDVPSAPNAVSSEIGTQPEKLVEPLACSIDEAVDAIRATGGTITSRTDDYISATYMSRIFKFIDDVEIRAAGPKTCHIRSASRMGYSDRGVNKRRVEMIRATL